MFSTSSTTYSAKSQARCLASVPGADRHRFMVGTGGCGEGNEVQVLDFEEESNRLSCVGRVSHSGEVWALAPCPSDGCVAASCGTASDGRTLEARV